MVKLLWFICFVQYVVSCYGLHWKDFYGNIPDDAIEAGNDIRGDSIYVGQAFKEFKSTAGIFPAMIQRDKDIYVPIYGSQKADNFVQILCDDNPENFHWITTNATHFHLLNTDEGFVRGGIENNRWLYIGRVRYQGSNRIGKVLAGHIGNADMWFIYDGNEIKVSVYEVLTYKENHGGIDVRLGEDMPPKRDV